MAVGAFAAVTVASTLIQMEGSRREAKAQEEAAFREAEAKEQQASDIFERFQMNTKATFREGQEVKGAQQAAFAKSGVDIRSGSTLLALEETNRAVTESIGIDRFEVDAQIKALKSGAEADRDLAGRVKRAGKLQRTGILLSGVGSVSSAAISRKK